MKKYIFTATAIIATLAIELSAPPSQASDKQTISAPVAELQTLTNALKFVNTTDCAGCVGMTPQETTEKKQIQLLNADRDQKMRATTIDVAPGDCSKISAAIKKLPQGGTIRLQEGDYHCGAPIIIDQEHIALIGAGRSKTRIIAKAGKALPVVVIGDVINGDIIDGVPYPTKTTHNVVMGGLTIDGNYGTSSDAGGLECWNPKNNESLACGKDSGSFIRNNALTIRRSDDVVVRNIATTGAYSGGITLEKKNKRIRMDDFTATENYFDGFAGYETEDSQFTNFNFHHNAYSGISLDMFFEGNVFENGSASFNGDNGIFSAGVGRNSFRHLSVRYNHHLGVYLDGHRLAGHDVAGTCDGDQFSDSEIIGVVGGMQVNFGCKNTLISHVKITQPDQPHLSCLSLRADGTWTVQNTTCSNGLSTQSIDQVQMVPGTFIKDLTQGEQPGS